MRVDEEVEDVEGGELSEAVVIKRAVELTKECINVPKNPFSDPSLKMAKYGRFSQLQ